MNPQCINFSLLQYDMVLANKKSSKDRIHKLSALSMYNLLQSPLFFSDSLGDGNQRSSHRQTWIIDLRDSEAYDDVHLRGALRLDHWLKCIQDDKRKVDCIVSFLFYQESSSFLLEKGIDLIQKTIPFIRRIYLLDCPFSQWVAEFQHLKHSCLLESNKWKQTLMQYVFFHQAYQDVASFLISKCFRELNFNVLIDVSSIPLLSDIQSCQYIPLGSSTQGFSTKGSMNVDDLYEAVQLVKEQLEKKDTKVLICSHDHPLRGCLVVLAYLILQHNMTFEKSFLYCLSRYIDSSWKAQDIETLKLLETTQPIARGIKKFTESPELDTVFKLFDQDVLRHGKDIVESLHFWYLVDDHWNPRGVIEHEILNSPHRLTEERKEKVDTLISLANWTHHEPDENKDGDKSFTLQRCTTQEEFLRWMVAFDQWESQDPQDHSKPFNISLFQDTLDYCMKSLWTSHLNEVMMLLNPVVLEYSSSWKNLGLSTVHFSVFQEVWIRCVVRQFVVDCNKISSIEAIIVTTRNVLSGLAEDLNCSPGVINVMSFLFFVDVQRVRQGEKPYFCDLAQEYLLHLLALSETARENNNLRSICLILAVIITTQGRLRPITLSNLDTQGNTLYGTSAKNVESTANLSKRNLTALYNLCQLWFQREALQQQDAIVINPAGSPSVLCKGLLYSYNLSYEYFCYSLHVANQSKTCLKTPTKTLC